MALGEEAGDNTGFEEGEGEGVRSFWRMQLTSPSQEKLCLLRARDFLLAFFGDILLTDEEEEAEATVTDDDF